MPLKRFLVVAFVLAFPVLLFAQDPPATPGRLKESSAPVLALAPAIEALSSPEKAAIVETLDRYFAGYLAMEPDALSSVLHPDAILTGGVGQPSLELTAYSGMLDQFRKMRNKATPPSTKATGTLTDVFVHGDLATAFVRMKLLPPTRGAGVPIDHALQLYRTGGRWTILSSVTHVAQYEGETDPKTLDVMGVRPGMTIGEIGAGEGRNTFALARRVGDRGKVIANDIDAKALAALRAMGERRGAKNIETLVGKADDPLFPKGTLDLAIIAITYHHLEQPIALLKNLAPSLKPGATLVIVDPAYDRTGDKDSDRPTTRERVEAEAAQAGYELLVMDGSLPRDNIFILRLKTGGGAVVPKVNTTPWVASQVDERAAILAAIDTWWKGHDNDDAASLEQVLVPGTRSWFEEQGSVQFISYDKEIARIRSGNRRPAGSRPLPGEKRTAVDFKQVGAVASVTMLVEIPGGERTRRSYTTFQLYKADDRWQIVNITS
jgi:SAM-dependent methyltransferase